MLFENIRLYSHKYIWTGNWSLSRWCGWVSTGHLQYPKYAFCQLKSACTKWGIAVGGTKWLGDRAYKSGFQNGRYSRNGYQINIGEAPVKSHIVTNLSNAPEGDNRKNIFTPLPRSIFTDISPPSFFSDIFHPTRFLVLYWFFSQNNCYVKVGTWYSIGLGNIFSIKCVHKKIYFSDCKFKKEITIKQ